MKIATKFCGEVEYAERDLIRFPEGIPGFNGEKSFAHITPETSCFSFLASTEHREVSFVTISPFMICPDYSFELDESARAGLRLTKPEEALILAIVNIPPDQPNQATVNLMAPVIINLISRLGLQIILDEPRYPLRQPLWKKVKTQVAVGK